MLATGVALASLDAPEVPDCVDRLDGEVVRGSIGQPGIGVARAGDACGDRGCAFAARAVPR